MAQQDDIVDGPRFEELHPGRGATGIRRRPQERGRTDLPHEQRGKDKVEFVDQVLSEKLGVYAPAPFHEQPPHPAPPELVEKEPPVEHGPGADDIGEGPQGVAGQAQRPVHGEDEPLAPAVPERETARLSRERNA
jgi:hypothetical protein